MRKLFVSILGLGLLVAATALASTQGDPAPAPPAQRSTVAQTPVDQTVEQQRIAVESQVDVKLAEVAAELQAKLAQTQGAAGEALQAKLAELETRAGQLAALAGRYGNLAALGNPQRLEVFADDSSGYLGIDIDEVTADTAKEKKLAEVRGVLVTEIEKDSPAAKAGLAAGDVILEFDGQRVEGTLQFRRMVRETPPERTVTLGIWRNAAMQSLSVTLGNRGEENRIEVSPTPPPSMAIRPRDFVYAMPEFNLALGAMRPMIGISAEDVDGQLAEYFGAPGGEGVLVRMVHAGTPAEKAGLKAGDIITSVDDQTVKTVSQLGERLREKREAKTVKLGILRRGSPATVTVEIEQPKPRESMHIARRAEF